MKHQKMDGVIKNVGKGSHEEDLPNRFARETLTPGTPMQRAQNYYGKKMRKEDIEHERMMRDLGMPATLGVY